MIHGRKRLRTVIAGISVSLAAVAAVGLVPVSTSWADPDIDQVSERVDRLYHQAEQAQERYHDARIELDELTRELRALEADQDRQGADLDDAQDRVEDSIVRMYEGEGLSAVSGVVVSDDPSDFLEQMSTMSSYSELQGELFDEFSTEAKALDIRRAAVERRRAEVATIERDMAAEQDEIDSRLAEAEDLLGDLKEEERREMLASRSSATRAPSAMPAAVPADVPASGRAAVAVSTALAQVGDDYVYGAMGPDAFDCSGLTMYAWGAAGVGLPHSSSAQFSSGPRVATSDLQPGDLVFYYSPISHVGMYIGNGMIVHAANPGTDVAVTGLYSMPFVGAVRPG